jgi:excisionase family DNA binding protein
VTLPDRLLSVAEVAAALGFEQEAIRRAVRRGELPASKINGRIRIDPADVQAWLQEGRVVADPEPGPARARPAARSSSAGSGKSHRRTPPGERGSFRERVRRSRSQ